ncbi:MAG: hypothetical protein HYZ73_01995 [Elusimicrobia bacterium]|nr:hypothetical protein [Elusimicrobiota bacterium]
MPLDATLLGGKHLVVPLEGGASLQGEMDSVQQLYQMLGEHQRLILMIAEQDRGVVEVRLGSLPKKPGVTISVVTHKDGFIVHSQDQVRSTPSPSPLPPGERVNAAHRKRLALKQVEVSLSMFDETLISNLMVAVPSHVLIDASGIQPGSVLHQVSFLFVKRLNDVLHGVVVSWQGLEQFHRLTQVLRQHA